MASIRERARRDGGTTYTVLWREDGAQRSYACETRQTAETVKRILDANGQSFTAVERVLAEATDTGPTLAEVFAQHLRQLTDVGEYQLGRYEAAIRDHFAELGARKVAGITREDISAWVNEMKAKPGRRPGTTLSAKTIANHHGLLSAAMSTAVVYGHRLDNPCRGVGLPKATHTEDPVRFMTRDEWGRILEGADPFFRPFLSFLVGTGLRFSEATALKAADFDLDAKVPAVKVSKAWKSRKAGGYYIGPPKTKKARRAVSLAPSTVDAVRPLVEAAGDGYVFTLKEGGVPRSGSFYNRGWEPALRRAGYAKEAMPRIHDIRHTHASWMVANGMDIFGLSHRLGHESVKTTMDRYSHLLPDAQFTASAIAQKALEP